jgi:phytoene synthase
MTLTSLHEAYDACADITRDQARNFHYGIRLLPADKRAAMCAVYALARRIDDIGDGALSRDDKLARLDAVRTALHGGDDGDAVLLAVHDAARRYPIPLEAFDDLIDGVTMDVAGARFTTFDEVVHYCRCVAGSIGRLCLAVFGSDDVARGAGYADALGVALQQTNILRDVREDLLVGRVYLAQTDLDRFGVELRLDADGALADDDGGLAALVRWSADRARTWYDDGLRLLPLLDRRSAACAAAMTGIYRRLLDHIAADPHRVYVGRTSLSAWQKSFVAARALVGGRP